MKIEVAKPYLDQQEIEAVAQVISSGWVSQGPKVAEFERIFADYVGAKHAIATTSCTTALHLALIVLGIEKGDEVIVPSLSFIATANSVIHAGATPVFADIDPDTCNIDPDVIEPLITDKTKAIMPVHQMGLPCDLDKIKTIADRHGLFVIEDAACAIGSEYKGNRIGGHGNTACFSFHPRKIITTGEGGMITTNEDEIAVKLKRLRHHGMSVSDVERHNADKIIIESYLEVGYNYRMTDIQAAMGIVQMRKLPEILKKRIDIASIYNEEFGKIPCLKVPKIPQYATHNYQSYWVELLDNSPIKRNELMDRLLKNGIATRRGIMAIHKEHCYSGHKVNLPRTERISENTVILPLHPMMTTADVDYVTNSLEELIC